MALKRFYLSQDQSAHWYIIPYARRAEWNTWRELPEDDERSWTPPAFAREVGGSPTRVTFERPEID